MTAQTDRIAEIIEKSSTIWAELWGEYTNPTLEQRAAHGREYYSKMLQAIKNGDTAMVYIYNMWWLNENHKIRDNEFSY